MAAAPTSPFRQVRRSARVSLFVIYLFVLGLACEGALQLFYLVSNGGPLFRRTALPLYTRDDHSVFRNRANVELRHVSPEFAVTIRTNQDGFRTASSDVSYRTGKDDGKFRIMLLGPSFAFGWGVEYTDSFGAILAKRLQHSPVANGLAVELINAGVPALPPANGLAWYRAAGRRYEPDLVVQLIYGGMEVSPALDRSTEPTEDGELVQRDMSPRQRMLAIVKQSALVFYTWSAYTRLEAAVSPADEIRGAGRELRVREGFLAESAPVAKAMEFYSGLKQAATGSGARLLVVYVPLAYVVHPEDQPRWRHLGVRDIEGQKAVNAAFVRYAQKRGIEALDITPDLVAAGARERLYYRIDIHWTPAGNRVAAEAVYHYLMKTMREQDGADGGTR